MEQNYCIRTATAHDVNFVYQVICELEDTTFDLNKFSSIYHHNIKNPDNIYLLLLHNTNEIGYISFHIQSLLHHCGLIGEIQEFYVDKKYRNKGLGKMLIKKIEEEAKVRKVKGIEVTSNKNRIENVDIYQKLGYKLSHNKFTKNL